jgi:hypothetical protein
MITKTVTMFPNMQMTGKLPLQAHDIDMYILIMAKPPNTATGPAPDVRPYPDAEILRAALAPALHDQHPNIF